MDKVHYIMQGYGDLADPTYNGGYKAGLHKPLSFPSLDAALGFLESWANYTETETDENGKATEYASSLLDPEDDMVKIWEVNGTKRKLVWAMFGWHHDLWEVIDQGSYIGHAKSVYAELMEDY